MRRSSFSSFSTSEASTPSSSSSSSSSLYPFSISISDTFDGGNGKLVAVTQQNPTHQADDVMMNVILNIKPDVYTELEQMCHMQYFFFRSTLSRNNNYIAHRHSSHSIAEEEDDDDDDDVNHDYDAACNGNHDSNHSNNNNNNITSVQRVCYILDNAEKASYPEAWTGTTVCYSTRPSDVDSWQRCVDTHYSNGKLTWTFAHDFGKGEYSVYFAFFPPYSYERHLSLVAQCASASSAASTVDPSDKTTTTTTPCLATTQVQVYSLGQTLQGREMDCIQVGTGSTICWIIHRQHPGETMAEHYAEGLLTRLLQLDKNNNNNNSDNSISEEEDDETRNQVLRRYTFYIIPCMCPDGAVLGHLRTNAVGANLNREWAPRGHYTAPTLQRSPEVHCVLHKMIETGVDMFLDVHGDEELPYNFMAGAQMVPHWGPRLQALHGAFLASYTRATNGKMMQRRIGYPPAETRPEVIPYMNVATNQISNRFECLGLTLEMPFKDCRSNPEPEVGWTPAKCRALGASVLEPLLYIHPHLRAGCKTTSRDGNDDNNDDDNVEVIDWTTRFGPDDAYIKPTDDYQSEPGFQRQDGEFIRLHRRFYSDVHESNKPVS
jgi:murein tripeptide amidase MpaA